MITLIIEGPIVQEGNILSMNREEQEFETMEEAMEAAEEIAPNEWAISEQPGLRQVWVIL